MRASSFKMSAPPRPASRHNSSTGITDRSFFEAPSAAGVEHVRGEVGAVVPRDGRVAPDSSWADVGGEEGSAEPPLAVDGKRGPPTTATAREVTGFGTAGQRVDPGLADTDGEEASAESALAAGGKNSQPLRPLTADDVRELADPFANTYFTEVRHQNPDPSPDRHRREPLQDWRMRERLKTVSVALVLCLNIGVDPPDVVKTDPCAKLECWVDPTPLLPQKALEAIGKNLQQQYEVWQPRARYRLALDPSVEETKKVCMNLRRNAKEERILFHYNGHGVPKPTASGELWVFNKDYTQYIPVSLYDLQTWLGSPCILVYDCSAAGHILLNFNKFAEQRDKDRLSQHRFLHQQGQQQSQHQHSLPQQPSQLHPANQAHSQNTQHSQQQQGATKSVSTALFSDCIQLAACGPHETLPMSPDHPADMFTSCLTTPIEVALRWFVLRNTMLKNITIDMVMKIPGRLNDRRTALGELNWIFTSITDTIAWNVLPQDLFKRLFRQDLMVAALFRNFLLADRIMRSHQCTPMSTPTLPPTHQHPMWNAWDLAMDTCLAQLPGFLAEEKIGPDGQPIPRPAYKNSTFFAEQLTAFEVWLNNQGVVSRKAPEQLPIVLQVLLSQVHRLRALVLLSRFLDLGPWAVNLALAVGIFPYVLKLLQSPAPDLKPVLIFIWTRILAVDPTCQSDLIKDDGYQYFVSVLAPNCGLPGEHISEHRAMCAFILSTFCAKFAAGQQACLRSDVLALCLQYLKDPSSSLRQWACLCVSKLWSGFSEATSAGLRLNAHEKLIDLLQDEIPEVRASAIYALGTLLGGVERTDQTAIVEHTIAISFLSSTLDGSHLVRREYVIALSKLVRLQESEFVAAANELIKDEEQQKEQRLNTFEQRRTRSATNLVGAGGSVDYASANSTTVCSSAGLRDLLPHRKEVELGSPAASVNALNQLTSRSVYSYLWKLLLQLSVDPHHDVSSVAKIVVDDVINQLLENSPTDLDGAPNSALSSVGLVSAHLAAGGGQGGKFPVGWNSPTVLAESAAFLNGGLAISHGDAVSAAAAATASFTDPQHLSTQTLDRRTALKISSTLKRSPSLTFSLKHLYSLGAGALTPPSSSAAAGGFTPGSEWNGRGYSPTPSSFRSVSDGKEVHDNAAELTNPYESSVLPLSSSLWEWSAERFLEPEMKPQEKDEPGSLEYNQREWRKARNENLLKENEALWKNFGDVTGTRWGYPATALHNVAGSSLLVFQSFLPHLIVADDKDGISVWDWEHRERLNMFSNSNPPDTKITAVMFVNEPDIPLLLVGSGEGVIRLYKQYEIPDETQLVSAWRALPEQFQSTTKGSGVIAEWQQRLGTLLVGGDVKAVKVWDAASELVTLEIPTRSGSCVTSLTSDQLGGDVLVAGFGDGAVRVYDKRHPPREAMVVAYKESPSWIVNVRMQLGNNRDIISGSMSGDIRLWDIRQQKSVWAIDAHPTELTALAVHDFAPVIASSGGRQETCMWNMSGQPLNTVGPYSGFMTQKAGAVRALAFHRHQLVMAAGGSDGSITITRGSIFH